MYVYTHIAFGEKGALKSSCAFAVTAAASWPRKKSDSIN